MLNLFTISFRKLFSKNSFGFVSTSSFLGLIGIALGTSALIIISCFSDGFSNKINYKISSLDGHFRLTSLYNDKMTINKSDALLEHLNNYNYFTSNYKFIESHAMIRNNVFSEGAIIYGVNEDALKEIFKLDDYLVSGSLSFLSHNNVILGSELANNLQLEIGDKFYLFNIKNIINDTKINAKEVILSGIIDTDFFEYDRLLAFINFNTAQKLFLDTNSLTGIVSSSSDYINIDSIKAKLEKTIDDPLLSLQSWKDRHYTIIQWLSIYDIPIKIVMFLIVFVALLNVIATIWMISYERKSEFCILISTGFKRSYIFSLILLKTFYLSALGSIMGLILALCVLFLQIKYQFISLSSDVYFMDYLPVSLNIYYFFIYPIFNVLLTLFLSIIPAYKISRLRPGKVLSIE